MGTGAGIEFVGHRKAVTNVENRSEQFRLSGEPYANFSFMMLWMQFCCTVQ